MRSKLILSVLVSVSLLFSCGSAGSSDSNLSAEENEAVAYVKKHLNKGEKLISYEIAKSEMPTALLSEELKSYRDAAYKAALDYQSCKTRGIEQGMEKAKQSLISCQEDICNVNTQFTQSEAGKKEYLFVLGKVDNRNGSKSKIIAAFDTENKTNELWLPLTKPVYNNALMVSACLSGKLIEISLNPQDNPVGIIGKISNPIVNFIIDSEPNEIK